jgi:hypothetical protein
MNSPAGLQKTYSFEEFDRATKDLFLLKVQGIKEEAQPAPKVTL